MRNLRSVSGWIFVFCLAAPGLLRAASPGEAAGPPESLHQRLEALDRRVEAHLRRVARQAEAGEATDPDLLDRAEGFLEQLAALERAAREEGVASTYEGKIRQLRLLVGNLEKSGREGASVDVLPRYDSQPVVPFAALTKAVPANDAGRYDVSLAPGYYFVSTDNRRGFVDEAFDGVLCPGGPASTDGCDPTLGTAVLVVGGMATGIDFALAGKWEIFTDGFESGGVSAWSSAVGSVP